MQVAFRGDSPIYYFQKIGKHALAIILSLQYFTMCGIMVVTQVICNVHSGIHTLVTVVWH